MGGKAILLLLVLAGGLGAVLYFTDRTPPAKTTTETAVLDGRSLTDATRIRWQFHEREPVEIGRAPDGRFQIQEPLVDLASMGYLRQIVNAWDSAQMRAVPFDDDEAGREKAGLSPPTMKLIVEWQDRRIEVEVGDPGPLGETRFLRRDGKIWEGGQALIESMRVGLDDLREKQVFRHQFVHTTKLRVEQVNPLGGRETLELLREGKGWQLTSPVAGRASSQAAQQFVTAVTSLRVDYFQAGVGRPPERDPEIKIYVKGAYGEENLDLWLEQGQVWGYLPERGHLFISDNRQYGQVFVNAANNLRARILVPMGDSTFEQLVELVIDPGQGSGRDRIRLRRQNQNAPWQLIEPVEYGARATPVNEAAHALQRLVARKFVTDEDVQRPRAEDPRYGMVGTRWSLTTRRVNETEMHTLWFGGDADVGGDEPLIYCARADEPDNVALVPKVALETLQRPWTVYCDKGIMKQPAVVERLDLVHKDGRKRTFRIQEDGTWQLDGSDEDRSEVGDYVDDTLRDFVGKRAVDMRTGFADEPDWTLLLMRRNGDELGRTRIWDPGPEARLIARGRTKPGMSEQKLGIELGKRDTAELRKLWK
jgi:hypothetical protein